MWYECVGYENMDVDWCGNSNDLIKRTDYALRFINSEVGTYLCMVQ